MGLGDIAGVLSRYFIVGFFLPTFFALVGLVQTVSPEFLPPIYATAGSAGQIAILGGAALLGGLLLLGVHHHVLRLLEGYPFAEHSSVIGVKQLHRFFIKGQRRRFRQAVARCDDTRIDEQGRFDAAWKLDRRFPHDPENPKDETLLLPTAFGNTLRACERHSFVRWHLNGIAAWPYIENLLSPHEARVLADARSEVAFFVNVWLLSLAAAAVMLVDTIEHKGGASVIVIVGAVVISRIAYAASIGAVSRWGEVVRASIDLHRLDMYRRLGLRRPEDFLDERFIAWHLNRALLTGEHLLDEYAITPKEAGDGGGSESDDVTLEDTTAE